MKIVGRELDLERAILLGEPLPIYGFKNPGEHAEQLARSQVTVHIRQLGEHIHVLNTPNREIALVASYEDGVYPRSNEVIVPLQILTYLSVSRRGVFLVLFAGLDVLDCLLKLSHQFSHVALLGVSKSYHFALDSSRRSGQMIWA